MVYTKKIPEEIIPQPVVADETITMSKSALEELVYSMKAMQKQIDSVEKKSEVAPLIKEKYTGPRKYSYKLFAKNENNETVLTPILSYRSVKENPNKDLVYKNEHDVYVNNQVVMLTLAGMDKEVKAPLDALALAEQSEKVFPKYLIDEDGTRIKGDSKLASNEKLIVTAYVFETVEHGEFTVLSKCIN